MSCKRLTIQLLIIMDYNKDNLVKDKAKTWKSFNKLSIYTILIVIIILIIIFNLF